MHAGSRLSHDQNCTATGQLWETAVSLARAVKLASERDDVDEEDVDSIIAHIDDYAV